MNDDLEAIHAAAVEKVRRRKCRKSYRHVTAAEEETCIGCENSPKKPWRIAVCELGRHVIDPDGRCDCWYMKEQP